MMLTIVFLPLTATLLSAGCVKKEPVSAVRINTSDNASGGLSESSPPNPEKSQQETPFSQQQNIADGPGLADAGPALVPDLTWQTDNYEASVALAKQQGTLLLVYMWAESCHPCHLMKRFVLEDPTLASYADRFVFLSVDAELVENRALVEKLLLDTCPTFLILEPKSKSVLLSHKGVMSLGEFKAFLELGEVEHRTKKKSAEAF